ncbi:putative polysaccharide biosynthesis protein [Sulfobacillus harzensis]|uniref:Polysaccharide biosynthesis protein n=1 Tax=Sulfobacillus harzensis TaxID=2729629 RepID=A0A7Y0L2F9_9FIRM|nr:polysaccharide biosynthesis protein [Sulfobacillus harzensis]NMP21506.1 polysaccharide biosynthesis protein [Sulfobacillus harzensis]
MNRTSVWRGAFWLSIGSFVSKLIGAVYRIFLPRVLGDYGVGLFQMAYPLYAILLAVSVNGIPTALAKQTAEKLSRGDGDGAERLGSWAQVMLGVVGMLLAAAMELSAPWIARSLFGEPASTWAIRALAPALAFVALEASFRGYFQGHQDMEPTAISQILEQVARVMVMFPLAYHFLPYGIDKAAAGATLGAPIGAMMGMVFLGWQRVRSGGGWNLSGRIPLGDLWRLVMVALPMSFSGLLFPMMLMADSVFVPGRLRLTGLSLEQATARFGQLSGEAMPLINLTMVVGAALAVSLVPAVARAIVAGDHDQANQKVDSAIHMVWLLGLPMSAGLMVLARPLTQLLYGESGSAGALQVLALGSAVLAIQQVMGSSLQAAGHGWVPVKNLIFGAGVKFLLTWWLTALPAWGIRGAAMGTVGAALTTAYLNWRDWIRIVGPGTQPFKSLLWPLVGTVVMAMGLRLWLTGPVWLPSFWHVVLAVPVGVVVYAAVMLLSGEMATVSKALKER